MEALSSLRMTVKRAYKVSGRGRVSAHVYCFLCSALCRKPWAGSVAPGRVVWAGGRGLSGRECVHACACVVKCERVRRSVYICARVF